MALYYDRIHNKTYEYDFSDEQIRNYILNMSIKETMDYFYDYSKYGTMLINLLYWFKVEDLEELEYKLRDNEITSDDVLEFIEHGSESIAKKNNQNYADSLKEFAASKEEELLDYYEEDILDFYNIEFDDIFKISEGKETYSTQAHSGGIYIRRDRDGKIVAEVPTDDEALEWIKEHESNEKLEIKESAEDAIVYSDDNKRTVASQIALNIEGEWDAIDGYMKLIPWLEAYNDEESIAQIREIVGDEKNHAERLRNIILKYDGDIPTPNH